MERSVDRAGSADARIQRSAAHEVNPALGDIIQRVPDLEVDTTVKVHLGTDPKDGDPIVQGVLIAVDSKWYQVKLDNGQTQWYDEKTVFPGNLDNELIWQEYKKQVQQAIDNEPLVDAETDRMLGLTKPTKESKPDSGAMVSAAAESETGDDAEQEDLRREWAKFCEFESSRRYAFRFLNKQEAAVFKKSGQVLCKGGKKDPLRHVLGDRDTCFVSASLSMAGARNYQQGGVGAIVIDLSKVTIAYTRDALLAEVEDNPQAQQNAVKAMEILIMKGFDRKAVFWEGITFPHNPDEYKKSRESRGQSESKSSVTEADQNRYNTLLRLRTKRGKLPRKDQEEFDRLALQFG